MKTTKTPDIQDQILNRSSELALDLIGLLATGYRTTPNKGKQLKMGAGKVIQSLKSVKALTLSLKVQRQKKLMADLEQITKVQARYQQNRGRLHETTANHHFKQDLN